MKKIKVVIVSLFLAILGLFFIYKLFSNPTDFKYGNLHVTEKSFLGGIVYNQTDRYIKIIDNGKVLDLPPSQSSRDIGLFDADGIIIEYPTYFEGENYKNGVFKICDISSLKLRDNNGIDTIEVSMPYKLCTFFDRVGWFPSIQSGFLLMYKDKQL